MLQKRKRQKMGVRSVERRFPRHYRFVKSFCCSVGGCQRNDIHVHHLRNAENSGTGLKPGDWYTISLCSVHHRQFHTIGHDSFEKLHGVDLWELARMLLSRTPDQKLRNYLKDA